MADLNKLNLISQETEIFEDSKITQLKKKFEIAEENIIARESRNDNYDVSKYWEFVMD